MVLTLVADLIHISLLFLLERCSSITLVLLRLPVTEVNLINYQSKD